MPRSESVWHSLPISEVESRLESNLANGLSPEEARTRLERFGPNALETQSGPSAWELIRNQIQNPIVYLLLGAAAVALLLQKWTDATVVLLAVVVNGVIGFIQEWRASRAIAAVSDLVPDTCTVIRGGQKAQVPTSQLVRGDLVVLQTGDKIPADLRLSSTVSTRVDEGLLTGESLPADKREGVLPSLVALGDRSNMAFSGTLLVGGTLQGLVVATGRDTELGHISELLAGTKSAETPLMSALNRVGKTLTGIVLGLALLLLGAGLARGYPLADALLVAVGLAVATIPEGLPAIVTIVLAIGVKRMAERKAIVRLLPSVETLGSTSIICSDKTGTLTRNEMTVRELWTPQSHRRLTGVGYEIKGGLQEGDSQATNDAGILRLLEAGVLCNDSHLTHKEGATTVAGDPTEGALLVAARKVLLPTQMPSQERLHAIPFDSEKKYMAVLVSHGGETRIIVKGAPEALLQRCSKDASESPLDAEKVHHEVERMATEGLRVMAFAEKKSAPETRNISEDDVGEGLSFLGLQGMIDPPREEAMVAIERCRRAGIHVKMITGDHKSTALAIGRQMGLAKNGRALTGIELDALDERGFDEAALHAEVFARVSPEHKIRIVKSLQDHGHVVAMTGDGVNDAPALKRANIGVAMGITGTAASKEAADIVLMDDNFSTIEAAVEEGRHVYDNLVKALSFLLPTNLGQGLIILFSVLLFPLVGNTPLLPVLPVQILWVNLVAAVALSLPLAFEAMEPDIMDRKPRNPGEPILNHMVLFRTVAVALLMTWVAAGLFLHEYRLEMGSGKPFALAVAEAQTITVTTIVLMQAFYLFNCRSLFGSSFRVGVFSNPVLYFGVALVLGLQLAFIYWSPLNRVFGSAPLDAIAWGKALLAGASVIPLVAAEKWFRRHPVKIPILQQHGFEALGLLLLVAGIGLLTFSEGDTLRSTVPLLLGPLLVATGLAARATHRERVAHAIALSLGIVGFATAMSFLWGESLSTQTHALSIAFQLLLALSSVAVILLALEPFSSPKQFTPTAEGEPIGLNDDLTHGEAHHK